MASRLLLPLLVLLWVGAAAGAERPNVVLILADDLGWNDVGYHGSEIRTPAIDALAARGVVLDHFYAFPTCTPTRAALLTGRSPLAMGLHGPLEPGYGALPADVPTLAEVLRDAGYQTALAGKWHLGSSHVRYWPQNRGFDSSYGNLTGGIGYWDKVHAGGYDWQRDGEVLREDGYVTDLIADEAVRRIEARDRSRPLFLYVSFTAPHYPNEAPEASLAKYPLIANADRRAYAGMVDALDAAIGRVLSALDAEGMTGDTLVIFASDNGGATPRSFRCWVPWLVPSFSRYAGDNAPLRGGKMDVFEGGIRVPAVWYWPRRLEGGRRVEARVTVQDVLPTLAEAFDLDLDPDPAHALHGTSRWDVLAHGADTPDPDFVVGNLDSYAYFRGPWKLVEARSPLPLAKPSGTYLFRPADDPREQNDLAAAHPEVVAELQAALADFPVVEREWPIPKPWQIERLFGGEETRPPWAETAGRD